jgi:hypothetical protein
MFTRTASLALLTLASSMLSTTSAQAKPGGVSSVALPDHRRAAITVRGIVRALRAEGSWFVIETDAVAPAEGRFTVSADSRANIPIAVGDSIDARVDCTYPGWHYVCNGVVRDGSGALLFAVAGGGEESLAPGWKLVGDGPPVRGQGRVEQSLVLEHTIPGQPPLRVTTATIGWRTLRAPDGEWLVSGTYTHTVGDGPRVPDSVDYRQYAITRVRPRARP